MSSNIKGLNTDIFQLGERISKLEADRNAFAEQNSALVGKVGLLDTTVDLLKKQIEEVPRGKSKRVP